MGTTWQKNLNTSTVIQYLERISARRSMYTGGITVGVFDKSPKCLYGSSDVIPNGTVCTMGTVVSFLDRLSADYQVIWSNSLDRRNQQPDITYGSRPLSSHASQFWKMTRSSSMLMVVDTDSGHVRGMEVKYAHISTRVTNRYSFDVSMDGLYRNG